MKGMGTGEHGKAMHGIRGQVARLAGSFNGFAVFILFIPFIRVPKV